MVPQLLQVLVECGGENEKYLLIPPTGEVNEEDSARLTSVLNVNKKIKRKVCKEALQLIEPEQNLFKGTQISSIKEECLKNVDEEPRNNLNDGSNSLNNRTHLHADIDDDADISLVDQVLQCQDKYLQNFITRHNILVESIVQNVSVSKKQKNKMKAEYIIIRKKLQCYTGRYLNDLFNPVSANKTKNVVIKHKSRCMALGMALARNSPLIKKLMCECIRLRSDGLAEKEIFYSIEKREKVKELISKEFVRFGDELFKLFHNNHSEYKNKNVSIPIYDSLVATNFISMKTKDLENITLNILPSERLVKIPNYLIHFFLTLRDMDLQNNIKKTKNTLENKSSNHNKVIKKSLNLRKEKVLKQAKRYSLRNKIHRRNDIKFVKENQLHSNNEESGIEYSDEERVIHDVNLGIPIETQQQGKRDVSHLSPVYINFLMSISRQVQQKPLPLKQNGQQTCRDPILDELENKSISGSNSTADIGDENQSLIAQKNTSDHDNEEMDDFFSNMNVIAKSLPSHILTKLKEDIKNHVLKALRAKKFYDSKNQRGKLKNWKKNLVTPTG